MTAVEVIINLIKDEIEAVSGYENAISHFTLKQPDESIVTRLKEIKEDEEEHIRELSELFFKIK